MFIISLTNYKWRYNNSAPASQDFIYLCYANYGITFLFFVLLLKEELKCLKQYYRFLKCDYKKLKNVNFNKQMSYKFKH